MKKLITLVALAAACGGNQKLSLSVHAGSTAATAARSALTLSNGVVLSRVRIVVASIRLERAKSADAGENDLEDDEMAAGPYLLDLSGPSLDGGVTAKLVDASLPPGDYRELKFKIHRPQSGDTTPAGIADMAAAGASIVVDGTIDGAAFTFSTPMDVEQKVEGSFTLGAGSNVTLNVDPTSWFGGAGSARLDPRDGTVKGQIESNIQRSFKAFRDDDHDGHDDDNGQGH